MDVKYAVSSLTLEAEAQSGPDLLHRQNSARSSHVNFSPMNSFALISKCSLFSPHLWKQTHSYPNHNIFWLLPLPGESFFPYFKSQWFYVSPFFIKQIITMITPTANIYWLPIVYQTWWMLWEPYGRQLLESSQTLWGKFVHSIS